MAYPIPERVQLYSLKAAVLDHFTVYTDLPREGEAKPPHGQLFAYYRIEGDEKLHRVPLGMSMVKFSPAQLPSVIATLFLKI